jgi:hypothetical protein
MSPVIYKDTGNTRIGILNRRKSRHITNLPELINELTKMDVSVSTIDSGCDLKSTADLDVPHLEMPWDRDYL